MKTEKKCTHCGNWSEWQKQPSDRCTFCNELLDPVAFKDLENRVNTERQWRENDYLRIRESDGLGMRLVRRTAWLFHVIFAAITWAFLWFVTTFSG